MSLHSHNLLDSKINTVLSMCQDTNLLNPVHGIIQSVVYHEESPPQYQPSYLQSTSMQNVLNYSIKLDKSAVKVLSRFSWN